MTDEEMAYEYAKYDDNGRVSVNDDKFKAFLAGLTVGRPQWHDLRKDKNDLPKLDKADMSDYVITDKGVAYYNGRVKSWYIQSEYILTDDVIAWCETPKYMEE
jgi:hypothetical protein